LNIHDAILPHCTGFIRAFPDWLDTYSFVIARLDRANQ
jgi:hypothetical protein